MAMNKITKIIWLCLFLGGLGNLSAQENEGNGIQFMDNRPWDEVVAEAVKQEKKIFVDCYTSWCGPCKALAKDVFPLKQVGDFFNANFVNVKYDMEQKEGVAFGKTYEGEVQNYPTMLVIDPVSGEILHKFVGKRSPDELIYEAKQGLNGRGLASLEKRYEAGERDYAFIRDYVLALSLASKKEELVKVIDNYFNENASFDDLLEDGEKWAFFCNYLYDIHSDLVQYVIENYLRLSYKSYVDKDMLRHRLAQNIYLGVDELLKKSFHDGQLTPFTPDETFRQMLGKDVDILSNFDNRESCVALLKLYDRLMAEEWEKAFELLTYIREFEMYRAVRTNYVNVCLYIAEQTENKELKADILIGLEAFQEEFGKKLPNFNTFNCIAFVQKQLGDTEGAKLSMKKYEELDQVRKKQFKQTRSASSHKKHINHNKTTSI